MALLFPPNPVKDDEFTDGSTIWICTSSITDGDPVDLWDKKQYPERGGVLHDITGVEYVVGDMVGIVGSQYIYHCILDHTSTVTCVGDAMHWTQPGTPPDPVITYDFTSDLLGESTGVPGSIIGPHVPWPTPDENGPYFFSVPIGSIGLNATVYIDGFKLRPDEYDTVTDGYVHIYSPVSDNSWVQITV